MPAFHIEQFGCRATQADGAAIERQLLERGCTRANSPNAADVVVLNTCTVTAAADAQARDAIRKLHRINPAVQIIVTGCYAQRAPEELAALPGVTFVVGNSHKPQIPDLVVNSYSSPSPNFVPVHKLAGFSVANRTPAGQLGSRSVGGNILRPCWQPSRRHRASIFPLNPIVRLTPLRSWSATFSINMKS
jgi:tRNA A37 methylthiotransferase MiaB